MQSSSEINFLNIDLLNIEELEKLEELEELEELQELGELEEEPIVHAPKRYIRDMQNPFEYYNDIEFKRRYRFNKHSTERTGFEFFTQFFKIVIYGPYS